MALHKEYSNRISGPLTEENISRAKAQRRKESPFERRQRFAPLRLCASVLLRTNCLLVTSVILMLLVSGTLLGSNVAVQEKPILPENYFPDGPGRDLVFQSCVQCHDLHNTVSQRKTAAAWKRTVDEMIWRGAPLMSDEAEIVTKYLAASFGPDKAIPEELKAKRADKKR